MAFARLSGAAALAFVATVVVATAIVQVAGLPSAEAKPGDVTAFFTGHTVPVGVSSALAPLAWLLLTVFGAGALARIRASERSRGEAWSLIGLAGIVMNTVFFGGAVVTQIAILSGGGIDQLWPLHNAFFAINGISLATALAGFSIGGLRAGIIHTWHAALGLTAAALQLAQAMLAPATLAFGRMLGLAGFLLWLIWLAIFGVILLRTEAPAVAGHTGAAPA
jgi:hypothetical protein